MAFVQNTLSGHATSLGSGTIAEFEAWLAVKAATAGTRAKIVSSTFTALDGSGNYAGTYMLTATTYRRIDNVDDTGTMSSFTAKVGSTTASIEDAATLEFAAGSILSAALDATGKVVTYSVASTIADAGKVAKVDVDGVVKLLPEAFLGTDDTNTIDLTVNGTTGKLTAEARIKTLAGLNAGADGIFAFKSVDSDNAFDFGTDGGLFTKKMKVNADSGDLLTIDTNYEIHMTKLALAGEWYSTTETTIAAYVASAQFGTDAPQLDDKIALTNAAGFIEIWAAKVKNPTTAADFIQIANFDPNEAWVRSLFSGKLGVIVNQTTGEVSADLRAVDATHANDIELDGDSLFVDILAKQSNIGFGTQNLQKNLTDLYNRAHIALNRTYSNALTTTVDGNGYITAVEAGGDYTKATTYQALNNNVTFASSGTGRYIFSTDNVDFNSKITMLNDAGERVTMRLSAFNTWYSSPNS